MSVEEDYHGNRYEDQRRISQTRRHPGQAEEVWLLLERRHLAQPTKGARLPHEVASAAEATQIALAFVRKHNLVASPFRAVRQDDVWLVEVDVGYVGVRLATFKIDARTAKILEYQFPEATLTPM